MTFSLEAWKARVAAGLCGDCGAPRVTATSCRACFHRHYCWGPTYRACCCPTEWPAEAAARAANGAA